MKKYFHTILIVLLLSTLSSFAQVNQKDANGKKTGLWQTRWPNDSLKSEGHYKADKAIGLWTYWYETGELMAYMEHLDDGITCNFKLFDPVGPRIAEGLYVNKKKEGTWYYYSIDSSKVCDEVYVKGEKNGEERVYYPKSGKLFQATNFKDGKKDGWWKQFYPDGILKTDGKYKNDTLTGKVIYYHPTGKKHMEGNYVANVRDGEFYLYDEDGKLVETLHYKMGVLDEEDLKRHIEGEIKVTLPEDVIYQGGYEQYNPNNGGGGGGY